MDLIKIFTEATLTEQIAYILGVVGVVECFFIFYSKTREQILFFKFLCDVIWLTNYLLLGNITGSVINGINMVREVVFYHRGKKKWATSHIWVAVFLIATRIAGYRGFLAAQMIADALSAVLALFLYRGLYKE